MLLKLAALTFCTVCIMILFPCATQNDATELKRQGINIIVRLSLPILDVTRHCFSVGKRSLKLKVRTPRLQHLLPQKLGSFKDVRFRHAFSKSSKSAWRFFIFSKKKKKKKETELKL